MLILITIMSYRYVVLIFQLRNLRLTQVKYLVIRSQRSGRKRRNQAWILWFQILHLLYYITFMLEPAKLGMRSYPRLHLLDTFSFPYRFISKGNLDKDDWGLQNRFWG